MSPDWVQHRVMNWLSVEAALVYRRLWMLRDVPTLLVARRQDRLLPSAKEVERLSTILINSDTLVVPNRSHFVLDQNVNLTEALLSSKIIPLGRSARPKAKFDPIADWSLPSQ